MRPGVVPSHDTELDAEGDVIRATIPFFSNVLEVLAPYVLRSHGFNGKIEWRSEPHRGDDKGGRRRPDVVITYAEHIVMILDYKAPNFIPIEALEQAHAPDAQAAQLKLSQHRSNTGDAIRYQSLLDLEEGYKKPRSLFRQAVRYCYDTPYLMFYDYNTLLLTRADRVLPDTKLFEYHIFREPDNDKSKPGSPRPNDQNHIAMALRWIVKAVTAHSNGEFPESDRDVESEEWPASNEEDC